MSQKIPASLQDASRSQRKRKRLPQEMRVIGNILVILPAIFATLYAIGAMRFEKDQLDTIISTAGVFFCLAAPAMLNWSWYFLENSGD